MGKGLYIVVEGPDGVGKTTAVDKLYELLSASGRRVIRTRHPGQTETGAAIRQICRSNKMSPLSEQLLMMADHIEFLSKLRIDIDSGAIVLADRCNLISGLAYGLANGLSLQELNRIFDIGASANRRAQCTIDRMYVLRCDNTVAHERLHRRAQHVTPDKYDASKLEFKSKIKGFYDSILSTTAEIMLMVNRIISYDNIKVIDSDYSPNDTESIDMTAKTILADLSRIILQSAA